MLKDGWLKQNEKKIDRIEKSVLGRNTHVSGEYCCYLKIMLKVGWLSSDER